MSGPGWHGPAEAQSSTCPSHVTFRPHPLKRQSWAQKPQNEKVDPGIGQWPTPDRESLPPRVLPPCIERAVKLCMAPRGIGGHGWPWPISGPRPANQPTMTGPGAPRVSFPRFWGPQESGPGPSQTRPKLALRFLQRPARGKQRGTIWAQARPHL